MTDPADVPTLPDPAVPDPAAMPDPAAGPGPQSGPGPQPGEGTAADAGRAHSAEDQQLAATRALIAGLPFCTALGVRVLRVGEGEVELAMPWSEALVGDPQTGVIHGGAVSALMDSGGAAAVMLHPGAGTTTATLDLRIDYMRSATPGQTIRARATCFHMTRSVGFVRAVAMDDNEMRPVATATGAFAIVRGEDQA